MILLKNHKEFEEWKENNTGRGDIVDEPKEFPCFVYPRVTDWQYETIETVYLYCRNIDVMQNQLKDLKNEN